MADPKDGYYLEPGYAPDVPDPTGRWREPGLREIVRIEAVGGVSPLSITGSNGTMAVGDAGSFTPTISGGKTPYTVSATNLPPGRTITNTATGLTTGAYTTAGTYNATYTVTDALGTTASFTRIVTVTAAVGTFSGIVASRGAIVSRATITPAAGAITGQTLSHHMLTAPTRYLKVGFQNLQLSGPGQAGLVTTGLPVLTLSTGVRIRVQTNVGTQVIKAAFVEDVTAGQTGATRDVVMNSGAWGWLYLDLGQEYAKGVNLCFQEWPRWASLPAYYPETDTAALAFQEVNQFGAALADLTLGDTQWSSVTKATSYGVMVPRVIIGVGLSAKPKSFILLGDSISSAGSGDTAGGKTATGAGFYGYAQMALGNDYGWSNTGCTGLSLAGLRTTANRLAASLTDMLPLGFTHLLCALGPNDIASSRSVAGYLADLDWLDGQCTSAGVKLVPCTIPPRPATTDVSQSTNSLDSAYAGNNGGKPAWQAVNEINAAIRTDKSGSPAGSGRYGNGIGDVHKSVASATDPTIYRTDIGAMSGDRIHFPTTHHAQARDDLKPILAAA